MGYAGKWQERQRARELRAESWTLQEIADELGVAKGTVSVWVRDVDFVPRLRIRGHPAGPQHPMRLRKEADLERCRLEAEAAIGELSTRELLLFGTALYAGEGSKTGTTVSMANTNPALLRVFVTWLRTCFEIDESRLRVKLYLHEGLDLRAAELFWADVTNIPRDQFRAPYRAAPDPTRRTAKYLDGCATVLYSDALLHRRVMALIAAVTSRFDLPG